ncbi:fimbria/pilus periplasmic chaperone [Escherichia coli]
MKPALKKTLMAVACRSQYRQPRMRSPWTVRVRFLTVVRNRCTENIANDNKQLPYLAQAWIVMRNRKNHHRTIVVTPPVQRLSRGRKRWSVWPAPRISANCHIRESLFYFNLREIPP